MLIIVPKYKLWFTFHPLGALAIAATARDCGEKVELIDGVQSRHLYKEIDKKISRHRCIGISANIAQAHSGKKIAAYIRKNYPDKTLIWGGPYPSVEYFKLLPEYADLVVIGEGERQISSIIRGGKLEEIPGIAYFKNGKIKLNPREPYIQNLDELPFPAWDLSADFNYRSPGRHPSYTLQTERGCPFKCINCTKIIHGNQYRTRSVEKVVAEIKLQVETYGAREIHIWDDNFTLDVKRAKAICRAIITQELHHKVRFALPNGIRADICDEELFELMRKANFYFLVVAVESADQKVIDQLQKGLDLSLVRNTVTSAVNKGFRVGLFFMMGLPFETEESLRKTIEFAASLPAHHAFFWRVTPFPGTRLYDMINQNQEKIMDYSSRFIEYGASGSRFNHHHLTERQLKHYHRFAYRRFYGNPRRLWRILRKITSEGSFGNDVFFLIRCAINLLLHTHR